MTLSEYVSGHRRSLFDDLLAGRKPSQGEFDEAKWRESRDRGTPPQYGSTHFEPNRVDLEFIYAGRTEASLVLTVRLTPPERIVFMPVPTWVVEQIWQGEIAGSYHFESDALRCVEEFKTELSPEKNLARFGRQEPTRRD